MYILALMAVSGPSLRLARRSAERTFPPFARAAIADAENVRIRRIGASAMLQNSPLRSFNGLISADFKTPIRCDQFQQSYRRTERSSVAVALKYAHYY